MGALLKDGTFGCHQALANAMTRKRYFGSCGLLSNGGCSYLLRLFWRIVALVCQLPLYERLHLRRFLSKEHDPFRMLLRPFGSLFFDEGSPFTVVHLCAKGNRKRDLDKNHSKRRKNE